MKSKNGKILNGWCIHRKANDEGLTEMYIYAQTGHPWKRRNDAGLTSRMRMFGKWGWDCEVMRVNYFYEPDPG